MTRHFLSAGDLLIKHATLSNPRISQDFTYGIKTSGLSSSRMTFQLYLILMRLFARDRDLLEPASLSKRLTFRGVSFDIGILRFGSTLLKTLNCIGTTQRTRLLGDFS